MAQIDRTGVIRFTDGCMSVTEEGISGSYQERGDWEKAFKRDVFARIVQQLNRLGWAVQPNTYIFTGDKSRYARKGDLRLDLRLSGRVIEIDFFQSVNAPTRPDHAGRYELNKEKVMPFLLWLEMERTRKVITKYLCNVFSGYSLQKSTRNEKVGINGLTALEYIEGLVRESGHFKQDLGRADWGKSVSYRKTADSHILEQGQRVWFFDSKGRIKTGNAFYNLNNMWWVVSGKYAYTNKACFELYGSCPENPREKRNAVLRRKRLEQELSKSVAGMDFKRADVIKKLLWPTQEPLYVLWHKDHKSYHRSGFCGYTRSPNDAGKFTLAELDGWNDETNDIVPLEKAV